MVPGLEEVDAAGPDEIDNPMFLGETARPNSRCQIFKRLRLSNTACGITQDGFDKNKYA
jgi:hypothetical protein